MTSIAERYDRSASAYLEWWAPVLAPSAVKILELIAPKVDGGSNGRLIDIGTGTGALAIAAAERWPRLSVSGLDGSTGMLAIARREARRRLGVAAARRIEFVTGLADRMPYPDSSFDAAVSSFVLQLVPHRSSALRETLRILRPGGVLAFVTWLHDEEQFPPDQAFFDVLDELEVAEPEETEEARSGDFRSVSGAATELRRAGFRDVSARAGWLEHRYDRATYLDFLERYAERSTFEGLSPALAREVRARTAARLAELTPEAFTWRMPIVTVRATRPC